MQAGGLHIPTDMVLLPVPDDAHDVVDRGHGKSEPESYYAPDYVFWIEHCTTKEKYIFDLGMRPDLENVPPLIKETVLPQFRCEPKSPADILAKYGTPEQQPEKVKAVIFSHMHFDHVGDGAKAGFATAEIWVGATCCTYARPGYPIVNKAPTLSDTLPTDGTRKIVEAYIPDELLKESGDKRVGQVIDGMKKGLYNGVDLKNPDWVGIGAFDKAFDLFGDGSAFLIDSPGHSAGHQMMLIRTTAASDSKTGSTFVLLAGDCFHHPEVLKDPRRTARSPYSKSGMHADPEAAMDTIWRTRRFAEEDNVWVLGAHDFSVNKQIAPGKQSISGLLEISMWKQRGWNNKL